MENLLVISDGKYNGKGSNIILGLGKHLFIYNITLSNNKLYYNNILINLNIINTIIFNYNEALFTFTLNWDSNLIKRFKSSNDMICLFTEINNLVMNIYPNIIIYNDPLKCFCLGDKINVYNKISYINNNIISVPKYLKLTNQEDISTINFFPVIIKISNGSNTKNDTICHTNIELLSIYNKYFKNINNVLCVQYINSHIKYLKCNHSIRFMVINNTLIDYYIRPSNEWNIHTNEQDSRKIYESDTYFKEFFNKNKLEIDKYLNDIFQIFGHGFYAYDLILYNNKLYICEIGLKMFDDTYVEFLKNNNIQLDKISTNFKKLKKYYMFKLNN